MLWEDCSFLNTREEECLGVVSGAEGGEEGNERRGGRRNCGQDIK